MNETVTITTEHIAHSVLMIILNLSRTHTVRKGKTLGKHVAGYINSQRIYPSR